MTTVLPVPTHTPSWVCAPKPVPTKHGGDGVDTYVVMSIGTTGVATTHVRIVGCAIADADNTTDDTK